MPGLKVKHDLATEQQRQQHEVSGSENLVQNSASVLSFLRSVTQLEMSIKQFVIFSLAPTWKTMSLSSRLCYPFADTISGEFS